MATQKEADQALREHEKEIFKNPNVLYLAVVPEQEFDNDDLSQLIELDSEDNYIIEAGIADISIQEKNFNKYKISKPGRRFVPKNVRIQERETFDRSISSIDVPVLVKHTQGFGFINGYSTSNLTKKYRPANGGVSIGNPKFLEKCGTFGVAITLQNRPGKAYILTNWHVVHNNYIGGIGEKIIQQSRYDGGTINEVIGELYWYCDIRKDNYDAALIEVYDPHTNYITGGTRCFGAINKIASPKVGQPVKKCGRTTGETSGRIRSINGIVNINLGWRIGRKKFYNQIFIDKITSSGDSGSVLCDYNSNDLIGLIFAEETPREENITYTAASPISSIFGNTILKREIAISDEVFTFFPEIKLNGFV